MNAPVFGREPSRPLPRDDESEPTQEIDLDDEPLIEDLDSPSRVDAERERAGPGEWEPDVEEPEPSEPTALDVEEPEATEPAALDLEETDATEGEGEPDRLDVEQLEADEPVVLGAEEPESGEPATEPAEPIVVDAEAVSVGSNGAGGGNGADSPWVELQLQFVDDPQDATAGALRMLREALDAWTPAGASTEDLRVAFQRYRAAYHDLAQN